MGRKCSLSLITFYLKFDWWKCVLVLNKLQCLYTEKLTLTELFATVIFNWGKTTRQEKKYRLLAFFYITKIVTLKSLFVKMVWCHFDSVAGQHGHKSLMQDLTWLTYQSTHHSLTSEATLFHQFPAKERRSFNPLTSKSDEHLISLKSFTTKSRLSIQFSPIPASPDNRGSTVQVKYWV